jgi:alpha/beta hydrolase family protein
VHGGALGPVLTRDELTGPRVAVLNVGGAANPDVLVVRRESLPPLVVKDWSRRGWLVRAVVAPFLARHELAMLERVAGLPGVPKPAGRIDRLAIALEYLEGRPLRRRTHARALPESFFAELEQILRSLAARGVAYLDLASPSNVLVTPNGQPALVDLGSAVALPLPGSLRRRLERRALQKLRARFLGRESESVTPARSARDLKVGGTRLRVLDRGRHDDPFPILLLPDAGLSSRQLEPIAEQAIAAGRRTIGVDLPGFGGSRSEVTSLSPPEIARQLAALLDALRVGAVDVVAAGWAALPAAALARRASERVRTLVVVGAAAAPDPGGDGERLRAQVRERLSPRLPPELRAELERELADASASNLQLAARETGGGATPIGVRLSWDEALAGRLFAELAGR